MLLNAKSVYLRTIVVVATAVAILLLPGILLNHSSMDTKDHDIGNNTDETPIIHQNATKIPVAIRIDDIQDYAFHDAQIYLLKYNTVNGIVADLSIIPKLFGDDQELVTEIKYAIANNTEISAHGWAHEDLCSLSVLEQVNALRESKSKLMDVLGVNVTVLVPPMYRYNNSTLDAMLQTGFNTISSSLEIQEPGYSTSGIVNVPATVEFSDYVNGIWVPKDTDKLLEETEASVSAYGYAVIVIHPQELMLNNLLNDERLKSYDLLVCSLKERYSFTGLSDLIGSIDG